MTPHESRSLKIGDRVGWQEDAKDCGEVVERDWSGVRIKWEKGTTTHYHHNDMRDVRRLPASV